MGTAIFTPNGTIDKIVQIHVSDIYTIVFNALKDTHNSGGSTIPNTALIALNITNQIEIKAKTIVVFSS